MGININNTGNSLYYREISPCLVGTSFDFPLGWVFSQLVNIPPFQTEQKLIGSDKPFTPSPFCLDNSSELFFPVETPPTLTALPGGWKCSYQHKNTSVPRVHCLPPGPSVLQSLKMFNPLNRPSFTPLGIFARYEPKKNFF